MALRICPWSSQVRFMKANRCCCFPRHFSGVARMLEACRRMDSFGRQRRMPVPVRCAISLLLSLESSN